MPLAVALAGDRRARRRLFVMLSAALCFHFRRLYGTGGAVVEVERAVFGRRSGREVGEELR
jgi:hypothetical protein